MKNFDAPNEVQKLLEKNGGFNSIHFDDMVDSLYKTYAISDYDKLTTNIFDSSYQYTGVTENNGVKSYHKFISIKQTWKNDQGIFCKNYIVSCC